MTKHQVGPKNGQWKGGRSVASSGYVLVRVGPGHHLADVRGYAYEHRLVAERVIGRRLQPGEVVHHRDHDKQNNSPENLQVVTRAGHGVEHRDELGNAIRDLLDHAPHTRDELAFLFCLPARRIGWTLSRLRRRGQIRRTDFGAWAATQGAA